jgi:TP901 family phage tail tape measure protein
MPAKQELLILINGKAKSYQDAIKIAKKETASFQKSLDNVAKAGAASFLGITGAITGAVVRYAQFEKTFTNVLTLLTTGKGKTKDFTKTVESLKKGVFDLRSETGETFESLNKGLFDIISASVPAEEAIDTLRAATQLSAAGATDAATATKALISATTAYGKSAGSAREIAEKFFLAQKFAVSTVGELATEFNKVAANSRAVGISFEEALGAASALTANGAKPATIAFTEFRAILTGVLKVQSKLTEFTPEVAKALSLQNIRQKGLVVALNETKEAVGGNVVAFQKLFPNIRAFSAAVSLTGEQSELATKIIRQMGEDTSRSAVFAEALAIKQATLEKAFARLTGSLDKFVTLLGSEYAEGIKDAAQSITELTEDINSMDKENRKALAGFLKWGAILSGIVTAGALFATWLLFIKSSFSGLATLWTGSVIPLAIKVGDKIKALGGFLGRLGVTLGRVSWVTFLAGLSGSTAQIDIANQSLEKQQKRIETLTTWIDFLKNKNTELTDSEKELLKIYEDEKEAIEGLVAAATTYDVLNEKVEELIGKQQELRKEIEDTPEGRLGLERFKENKNEEIALIEKEIRKLKELRNEAEKGFGTGEFLIRPVAGKEPSLDFGVSPEQEVPFAIDQEAREAEVAAEIAMQNKKKEILDKATQDRITAAKNESEILSALDSGRSKQELEFLKQQQEIDKAVVLAARTKNQTLKDLELSNLKTRQELLLEKQVEFNRQQLELQEEEFEQRRVLADELQEIEDESIGALNEKDLENLRTQIKTKDQVERDFAKKRLQIQINQRNQFLADEKEFGTNIANFREFLNKQEVQGVKSTAGQLAALQRSKHSTLKAIGQAAAVVNIGIATAEGSVKAYTALAGIPIVGPTLGALAAAALIAFGAEQTALALGFNKGGTVPHIPGVSTPGVDSVPAMLTPDEVVMTEDEAPIVKEAIGAIAEGGAVGGGEVDVNISMKEEAGEMFDAIVTKRRAEGTSQI